MNEAMFAVFKAIKPFNLNQHEKVKLCYKSVKELKRMHLPYTGCFEQG